MNARNLSIFDSDGVFGNDRIPRISDGELAAKAQATLQNYETNMKLLHILATAYGFKTYFFWQPVLAFGAKPLAPFEQELAKARSEELGGRVHRGLKAVYQEAETRSAAFTSFVFLGHVFDEVGEPLYIDEFHLDAAAIPYEPARSEPDTLSSTARRGLRLQPFGVHARLWQFHDVLQLAINPQFNRKTVEVVIQAHPGRVGSEMLNGFRKAAMACRRNGRAIESDTQVISHGLNALMILSLKPG